MSIRSTALRLMALPVLVLPALLLARPAAAATVQTSLSYTGPLPAGITTVKVENLAGHAQVTLGPRFQVTATVVAGGSDQAAAQALAQSVHLDTSVSGGVFTVHVHYPLDQYDSYQYPARRKDQGNDSGFCLLGIFCVNGGGNSNLKYQDNRVRVYVGGTRGTPLYVDLAIQVPAGTDFSLLNYMGLVETRGLKSNTRVKTAGADVQVHDHTGAFFADTGSGDVHVETMSGDLGADTGSGDVFAEDLKGNLHADTGSGDVHLSNSRGQMLYADTGSGDVFMTGTQGDMKLDTGSGDVRLKDAGGSLHADTGSGDVIASGYTSGDSVWADTGSGDVTLAGDFSAMRKFYIDTGSGDATLKTTAGLSLHLDASSDSGDLNINLPDMRNVTSHRGSFSADFGKAEGRGTISTGSGDISISGN